MRTFHPLPAEVVGMAYGDVRVLHRAGLGPEHRVGEADLVEVAQEEVQREDGEDEGDAHDHGEEEDAAPAAAEPGVPGDPVEGAELGHLVRWKYGEHLVQSAMWRKKGSLVVCSFTISAH